MAGIVTNPAYEADDLYADTQEVFDTEYFDVSPETNTNANANAISAPAQAFVTSKEPKKPLNNNAYDQMGESTFSANPLYGAVLPASDPDHSFILQTLAAQQNQLARLQWLVLGLVLTCLAIGVLVLV